MNYVVCFVFPNVQLSPLICAKDYVNLTTKYLTWSPSLRWQWNTEILSALEAQSCLVNDRLKDVCRREIIWLCVCLCTLLILRWSWVVMMSNWLQLYVLSLGFLQREMDRLKCTYCYLFFKRWCLISRLNYFVSVESNNKTSNVLPLGFFQYSLQSSLAFITTSKLLGRV